MRRYSRLCELSNLIINLILLFMHYGLAYKALKYIFNSEQYQKNKDHN